MISLWAATDARNFSSFIRHRWKGLDVSETGYLISGLLAAYVLALWLTRKWHQRDRDVYRRLLGEALDKMRACRKDCAAAETDKDFKISKQKADDERGRIRDWMLAMMGQRAWEKFDTRVTPSHSYEWPGEHDQEVAKLRNLYLDALPDFAANLEAMMQSEAWDPAETLSSRRWKQRTDGWKAKLETALAVSLNE